MKTLKTLTALLTATLLLSMAAPANPGPGTVVGRATTLDGKPLAGVKIWVKPVVTTGVYETRTDAGGYYQATGLPPVGYRVYGWYEKEYNDQRYCLRLGHKNVEDYSPLNPAKGAVRNLVWLTEGRVEDMEPYSDMGFFGGSVSVMDAMSVSARNQPLEFTLTPTGPLIDGSKGKVLTRKPNAEGYLLDVPIGVYKVMATINENGAKKPVRLSNSTANAFAGEAMLEFKPDSKGCVGNFSSNAPRAYLYWSKGTATAQQGNSTTNQPANTTANQPKPSGQSKLLSNQSIWEGTVMVNGGDTYYVRYVFTVQQGSLNGRGVQESLWKAEFFECSSLYLNCVKLGWAQGVRQGDGITLVTMLEENNNSFATDGVFEGDAFSGTTNAVFDGQTAEVQLERVTGSW